MSDAIKPPPRRENVDTTPKPPAEKTMWEKFSTSVVEKGLALNDWAAGHVNHMTERAGGERFWPSSNDFPLEIEKCIRILKSFTTDGVVVNPKNDGYGKHKLSMKGNVVKKIPPQVFQEAKGICIYSSMKTAVAPMGGMNGTGLLLGRLPDGSWSAPSAICPNYISGGLVLGFDIMDVILIINTKEMLDSFKTHKFSITAETGLVSGPLGADIYGALDIKKKVAPIYSYTRSRGFYGGIELTGQAFIDRFDENERFYYWPGIKAGDILDGKVMIPPSVLPLHQALRDAELGISQGPELERPAEESDKEAMVATAGEKQDVASSKNMFDKDEDRMRIGAERWIGLAVDNTGVFTCTSGGAFRFIELSKLALFNEADADVASFSSQATIAVGTKEGIVRVYEPGKNKNRHIAEWNVVPKTQGSIRTMALCSQEKLVFIGDTTRTLYAVDGTTGRVLFQYQGINGSITDILVVPGSESQNSAADKQVPLVLGSSLDRLVHLFDTGEPRGKQRTRGKSLYSYFSGIESVTSMVLLKQPVVESTKEDDDDEEEFWDNLAVVNDGGDDDSDAEGVRENAPKRQRSKP
ncbi:hypothetical protein MCUN1_000292 [Malassezia cuniculi]|uniref:Ysc84 actin-binding domain-containing protein n=1 Tax=Malassezia cuniculi TaxID=948313 RepID=A0AAF0J5K0_9BASI|nr:hypothetical protein MCUN1_000292 [Malassezia cuniculi]